MEILKCAAVIVETRPLKNLKSLILEHKKFLPKDWHVILYGSELNYDSVPDGCLFVNMNESKMDFEKYNRLLTSRSFWTELMHYDKVLIFQHDSMLLRKGIEKFLNWDYIGAPWKWDGKRLGGNGGLSIRSPKKHIELIDKIPYNPIYGNEDVYFSHHLKDVGGLVAPSVIGMQFAVETIYYDAPIGIHSANKYLSQSDYNKILTNARTGS
jgi:hypothetical protein